MKVCIYARVSTDDKGQDPVVQIDKCQSYCEMHNHEIVEILRDEGVSGDTFYYDREGGKQLQELMNKNRIQGVVVFAMDRFSRQSPLKILPMLNSFKDSGITFISVTEPIFNMEGDFAEPMRYMITWFSNYFLKQHVTKVRAGLDKAKKYGTKSGKPIGRERKADYEDILCMHEHGVSISQIAKRLGYNKSSVKHAIDKEVKK